MDSAVQRRNMVDSQVRPSDVTDRRIPRAMLEVPREAFVPAARRAIAYMDGDLAVSGPEVAAQRALMAPRTLAKMIQALEIGPDALVLDVGPATGYSTAVLAHMARHVVALEVDETLAEQAKAALGGLGVANVDVVTGPLTEGVGERGPFDAILVAGRVSGIPGRLLDQLKDGGRLVAILDEAGVGRVTVWRRYAMSFDRRPLFDAEAVLLPGFGRKAEFVL
ncbi:MAG: protein-L-isoaspartate O-methyltransferase [Hyphomicrobiaceae bacterium]|nr:protein-L-isoaspartate O-methyltransferase [Hyphomicrobiaceae bacterium]